MHLMMLVGMLCDIFYALAQKMPWQYLAVSFSVLGSLLLQARTVLRLSPGR